MKRVSLLLNILFNALELVVCVIALPQHSNHAGFKVWQTKPAVWPRQNQMPATD